jgi:hypothetical protein
MRPPARDPSRGLSLQRNHPGEPHQGPHRRDSQEGTHFIVPNQRNRSRVPPPGDSLEETSSKRHPWDTPQGPPSRDSLERTPPRAHPWDPLQRTPSWGNPTPSRDSLQRKPSRGPAGERNQGHPKGFSKEGDPSRGPPP